MTIFVCVQYVRKQINLRINLVVPKHFSIVYVYGRMNVLQYTNEVVSLDFKQPQVLPKPEVSRISPTLYVYCIVPLDARNMYYTARMLL